MSNLRQPPGITRAPDALTDRALHALRASESRYRRLFEAARDGILLLNAETAQIEGVNPYLVEMLGYSHTEFLGKKLWEVGTFPDVAQSKEMFAVLQREGYIRYDDLPLRTKGGKRIQVEFVSNVYVDDGVNVIQCNIRDITARKQAEESALREQAFTHAMLDSLPGLFYLIAEEGKFLRWNRNFEAVSGYSFDELSRLAPTDLFSGPDQAIIADKIRQVFATGGVTVEADFLAKDRTQTPYFFTGTLVEIDQKPCLIGMGIDITVRRRVEADRARLASILESTSDLVGISDPAGQLLYLNRAGRTALDVSLDEDVERAAITDFIPDPATDLGMTEGIPAAVSTGTWSGEAVLRSRGGREFPVSQVILAHRASDGRLEFLSTIMRDISERKQAETALVVSETRIKYMNRIYATLSGINALIVRVRNRDELFQEACRIAVHEGGFRMAMIGMLDRVTMSVVPVASEGKDDALLSAIKDVLSSTDRAPTSMVAQAIRVKAAVVSNDAQGDPKVLLADKYAASGVCSMTVLPLLISDEPVGVLALYASEREFFHDEEIALATELAGDIAFAIDYLDKRDRLDYLAMYDALTGLANRTLFLDRLREKLLPAKDDRRKTAVLVLDVERFRTVNEAFGHTAGDTLLKRVAERMVQHGGDASRFARLGADRFAIAASGFDNADQVGHYVEQRLDATFRESFRVGDNDLRVSVKVGIALFPEDGADPEALLRNSEAALTRAKAGGDRYLFFTRGMTERVAEHVALENRLRHGLEQGEFVLHYQPKVSLRDGKLTGGEALIRWNDPHTGLMPPGAFIPILEETGLIHEVGRWAMRQAIADHLRWRAAGLAAVRISVNVSPLQLRSRLFLSEIEQAIGIDPAAAAGLELEITESVIMQDVERSIATLAAIRALGVTIAIDDFGTGFSSLSYLSRLPVDTLKIDRSFVTAMTVAPEGLALVSTIINLAHSLKRNVVAEGVETEEQSRLLRLLKCDEMQGFLYSRPTPCADFEARFLAPLAPSDDMSCGPSKRV